MKTFMLTASLLLTTAAGAQTVYGKLLQELDSFEHDDGRYVVGGMMKRPGARDSVKITALSKRLYGDRTIIVARVKSGRQYILDDGKPRFRTSPRAYSAVIHARDSTASVTALYDRCLLWIGKAYAGGRASIDLQDRASGSIVVTISLGSNWSFRPDRSDQVSLTYSLTVQVKPGRIKVDQDAYNFSSPDILSGIELNAEARAPGFFVDSSPAQQTFSAADRAAEADREFVVSGLTTAINERDDW